MEGMIIMSNNTVYSVVVPLYNEETVINESYNSLKSVMDSTNQIYEILFINNGSFDNTQCIVENICRKDKSIKLINFSKNFGHKAAVVAGINESTGEAVIILNSDLKDPPEVIIQMIKKWKEGTYIVYGKKVHKFHENFLKKLFTKSLYRIQTIMTNINIPLIAGDFRLIDRKLFDTLNLLPEKRNFLKALAKWFGFNQTSKNKPLYQISSKVTYNELTNSAIFKGNRTSEIYDLKVVSNDKFVNN